MARTKIAETVAAQLADPCESLYRLISFTSRDLRYVVRQELRQWGLTGTQFGVLLGAADGGSVGEIADGIFSDPTSIGRVIERMEAAGLVERYRQPPDRRVVWVRLQPEGERLLGKVLPRHVARTTEVLGRLPEDERSQLVELLTKVRRQAAEAGSSARSEE